MDLVQRVLLVEQVGGRRQEVHQRHVCCVERPPIGRWVRPKGIRWQDERSAQVFGLERVPDGILQRRDPAREPPAHLRLTSRDEFAIRALDALVRRVLKV